MAEIYKATGYVLDPHGAVGYLGLKKYLDGHPDCQGIFLETAHPVKFLEVVEPVIGRSLALPEQIRKVMDKKKQASFIKSYEELKETLLP